MHMKDDHMRNSQLKPGYNVRIGVSGEFIAGVDISSERSDQLTLIPLLMRMEQGLGNRYKAVIADAGYESEENYTYLEHSGQNCYIKPQNYEKSKSRKYRNNKHLKENMPYDPDTDSYTCPDGRQITAVYESTKTSKSVLKASLRIFAAIKEDYAFRRFLTRGTENVRIEMLLMAMRYNFQRLHSKIQSGRSRQLLFKKLIA